VTKPQFTRKWHRRVQKDWAQWLSPLSGQKLTYLEIGVFEGGSAYWMLSNVLTHPDSRYIGIDVWAPTRRYPTLDAMRRIQQRAQSNLAEFGSRVRLIHGASQDVLLWDEWKNNSVDIAYIDGGHDGAAVRKDSQLVWPLVHAGGLVVWDDYRLRRRNQVKPAVDEFLSQANCFYELLWKGRQVGVRKLALRRKAAIDEQTMHP